jgi:murein DD-endopeptidase MepM/ murein hydrolase activator NlpD
MNEQRELMVRMGEHVANLYPVLGKENGTPTRLEAILGVPVDMAPGTYSVMLVDKLEGQILDQQMMTLVDGRFSRQNIGVGRKTAGLQPVAGELEAIRELKAAVTPKRYWERPLNSPTPDCENSPFGVKRYHNGVYIHDYHKGVDLRSPHGRPVRAIAGGVVKIATSRFRLHGGTVGLDHGHGLSSIYIHLSRVQVKPGDVVHAGDTLGNVGSTGFATGPHLHWGLYANGVPVNPDQWIPVPRC